MHGETTQDGMQDPRMAKIAKDCKANTNPFDFGGGANNMDAHSGGPFDGATLSLAEQLQKTRSKVSGFTRLNSWPFFLPRSI